MPEELTSNAWGRHTAQAYSHVTVTQVKSVRRTAYIHLNFIDASADIFIRQEAMLVSQVVAKWNEIQVRQMPQ